jgi:hypothetical protein
MTFLKFLPFWCVVAVACGSQERSPKAPDVPPAEPLPTPTLAELGGDAGVAEPADDGCGAGCLGMACRVGRLEAKATQEKDTTIKQELIREELAVRGKLFAECCNVDPPDPACKDPAVVTRASASAYRRAGDEPRALAGELSLLDADRYPKSALTDAVRVELAERAKQAESEAATAPGRDERLARATLIRFALGDDAKAVADLAEYRKRYASSAPIAANDLELALGEHYAKTKKFALLGQHITQILPVIQKQGRYEQELRARALSARASFEQKQRGAAQKEIDAIVKGWASKGEAFLKSVPEAELGRAGQALSAVGEALFLRAEEAREKADALGAPAFQGKKDMKSVQAYLAKDFKVWMEKRKKLIDDANTRYREVLDLRPVPPPKWVVHSAQRTGQMLESFATEFKKVPVPAEIQKDPELARVYQESLDGALEPQVGAARMAFKTCQSFARKFDQRDEVSRRCDDWLAQHPASD